MLRDLLSIAVKYTNAGRVVVGCRRRGDRVAIQVLDTGCGIDEAARERIFDIYHRADHHAENSNGTGIGLSIVRHLSDLLKHPVAMASTPGKGSLFTITVPLLSTMAPPQPETNKHNRGAPLVAMVFQDNTLRDTVATRLQRLDCSLVSFPSLEDAQQAGTPAPVLLCDYATPHSAAPPDQNTRPHPHRAAPTSPAPPAPTPPAP